MKNKQREFNVETVMYSLLGTLLRHKDDGTNFTTEILNLICPADEDLILDAIMLATKNGYMTVENERRFITDEGIDAYETAIGRTSFVSSAESAFREEVLSGTTSDGKETPITRAALPSPGFTKGPNRVERRAVNDCDDMAGFEQFLQKNGETEESAIDGLTTGRLGLCYNGRTHWGEFHRDGSGYRTVCKVCRRKK